MRHCAAQVFKRDLFSGYGLYDFRPGDKHIAAVFNHEHIIGHGRRVNSAAGRRPHDGRNLGDHAGSQRIAIKNIAVSAKGIHPFLNTRATGIVHAHKRYAGFESQVHDLGYFLGVHFTQTPGPRGKVLGKCKNRTAIHQAVTGDHTVRRDCDIRHIEIAATMLHKHVNFAKSPLIEQTIHPITSG